ncbi:deoxyribodipyrimidine photo-lyase [Motilimonas pumila]|uniref:Deoxyribodipyrimidine photo-lyase n=1 Tax=Motilimonas pumila TaxID=2303987 RepID=A0A418YFH3_9GAMM|nr:deoxyribodipyrimidine photo-lyase [Motilimonas pumila]RJG48132.1 deoxyribodipyrimidine photo-lyase [Motilimonas pumila]
MQLMWFRKDLRLEDNPALFAACQQGPTTAVYFVTPEQWRQHHLAPIQADFIFRRLAILTEELAQRGIQLLVEQVDSFSDIEPKLRQLCQMYRVERITANAEIEVNEVKRDEKLIANGLPLRLFHDTCVLTAGSVATKDGGMYKVFSAFRNNWLQQVRQLELRPLPAPNAVAGAITASQPEAFNYPTKDSSAWSVETETIYRQLNDFLDSGILHYHNQRDIPAIAGTSQMSVYLALGVVSVKSCVHQVLMRYPYALDDKSSGPFCWLNELAWREFYRHWLQLKPDLCKGVNFQELAAGIVWQQDEVGLQAWRAGRTGYPLVDAAMKQLVQTGWMHNRLRMVTASFLTKHLLINWRLGEQFFMQHLIDGDLAANNGGWQWAASTGCDAQPYFRIFNPTTQSEKFDPQGHFIRKYLPETAVFDNKTIHLPKNEIVDHKAARVRALDRYSVLKKG